MGPNPNKHTRAGKRRAAQKTERTPRALARRLAEVEEGIRLVLTGVRAAADIAARASEEQMSLHLHRHVINPLSRLIDGLPDRTLDEQFADVAARVDRQVLERVALRRRGGKK